MTDRAVSLFRLFIVATAIAMAMLAPAIVSTRGEAALAVAAIGTLLVASIPVFVDRRYKIVEPITFVVLLVLFGVSLKLMYILMAAGRSRYLEEHILTGDRPVDFLYGTFVVMCGLLCLVFGYTRRAPRVDIGRHLLLDRASWDARRLMILSVGLTVVSVAMFVVFVRSTGAGLGSLEELSAKRFAQEDVGGSQRIHQLDYYMYRGAQLAKFAFYVVFAWMLVHRKSIFSWAGPIVAITGLQAILVPFFINSRAGILLVIIDTCVIAYLLGRNKEILRMGFVAGAGVVLIGVLLSSRHGNEQSVVSLAEQTFAGRDLMDISKTAKIINAVPIPLEYRYGETLVGWLAAPIPRALWEEKPMWAERGPYLMEVVFGDPSGYTGMPPGLVAELYWNFGWFGVCGGMFLLGFGLRMLYVSFRPHLQNPNGAVIYTLVATRVTIFTLGNDLGTGILKAGLDLVPLLLLLLLIYKRRGVRATRPSGEVVATAPA